MTGAPAGCYFFVPETTLIKGQDSGANCKFFYNILSHYLVILVNKDYLNE